MDRMSHVCEKFAAEPLPYVSGLRQLIPEQRLVAILTRTARLSVRRRGEWRDHAPRTAWSAELGVRRFPYW
jgi:hypothetical protein